MAEIRRIQTWIDAETLALRFAPATISYPLYTATWLQIVLEADRRRMWWESPRHALDRVLRGRGHG